MPKESTFLMVNLKDQKTKKIAQAIQNETCKKILDLLAQGKKSESQIAEDLKMALSTVHYNLQLLIETKLVKADEYHYSQKGKEILHYSLANKFVIIAPSDTPPSVIDKLKTILPVGLIIVAAATLMKIFTSSMSKATGAINEVSASHAMENAAPMLAKRVAEDIVEESAVLAAQSPVQEAANQTAPKVVEKIVYVTSDANIILWFVAGAVFCLAVYLIIEYIRNKSN